MSQTVHSIQPEHKGNLVVNLVLDAIVSVSKIDPSWVEPDHSFKRDLELSTEEVVQIGKFVATRLKLDLQSGCENCFGWVNTPRELVVELNSMLSQSSMPKAS